MIRFTHRQRFSFDFLRAARERMQPGERITLLQGKKKKPLQGAMNHGPDRLRHHVKIELSWRAGMEMPPRFGRDRDETGWLHGNSDLAPPRRGALSWSSAWPLPTPPMWRGRACGNLTAKAPEFLARTALVGCLCSPWIGGVLSNPFTRLGPARAFRWPGGVNRRGVGEPRAETERNAGKLADG
jgi:hypothetical protein